MACINKIAEIVKKLLLLAMMIRLFMAGMEPMLRLLLISKELKKILNKFLSYPQTVHNLSKNISSRINVRIRKTFKTPIGNWIALIGFGFV